MRLVGTEAGGSPPSTLVAAWAAREHRASCEYLLLPSRHLAMQMRAGDANPGKLSCHAGFEGEPAKARQHGPSPHVCDQGARPRNPVGKSDPWA